MFQALKTYVYIRNKLNFPKLIRICYLSFVGKFKEDEIWLSTKLNSEHLFVKSNERLYSFVRKMKDNSRKAIDEDTRKMSGSCGTNYNISVV